MTLVGPVYEYFVQLARAARRMLTRTKASGCSLVSQPFVVSASCEERDIWYIDFVDGGWRQYRVGITTMAQINWSTVSDTQRWAAGTPVFCCIRRSWRTRPWQFLQNGVTLEVCTETWLPRSKTVRKSVLWFWRADMSRVSATGAYEWEGALLISHRRGI